MPRWRNVRMGKPDAGNTVEAVVVAAPDLDDLGAGALVLLAVVVVAVVVIPLVLFGIELILLGLLIATGIVGRTLLGRPWIVRATPLGTEVEELSWRVVGWRRSNSVIEEVATSLSAGLDPSPSEAAKPILTT